ncbi:26S proteasome non-ATPase regulatory subunit 13-like isoform X2 [Amblyraja radiata]|uniref:26S proteasome non-ATPase regulatory subunit 13-like isoform X2 n=1 Tax=Amblyraja radiata TaxID=386614 RepID=UPI001403085B|nr:26S proteasome non-ATPase regulatory subunit 13-like isoform X2 [Amblyraja radiata]
MKDPIGFLRRQQEADTGDAAERWQRMETFYNRRLWHQLTVELLEFTLIPCFPSGDNLLQLYENFISDFEHRINPLSLVEIILRVVRQMNDAQMALSLLEKTWEKVKDNDEALILCRTAIAAIKIKIGDLQETKKIIEEVDEMLEKLPGVTSVHVGSQQQRAFTLGLAALLGDGIYNFGELLMHPILESLRNTENQWLIDTLYAFNSGNVETFFSLKTNWGSQSDLANNEQRLKEKLQLLCLMEMVFTRPANHRQMTFQEISHQAKVPVDEVEMLVMKALSAGLVKGSIDEVDHKVHMTWVQPRVMDLQQVSFMKQRLEAWCADVKNISILVEDHAHEVLG